MATVELKGSDAWLKDLVKRMERYGISQNMLAKEMHPPRAATQVNRWFTHSDRRVKPDFDTMCEIEHAVERLRKKLARI